MKKVSRFLAIFFILLIITCLLSVVYEIKIQETEKVWLLYHLTQNVINYLPMLAGLSALWSLVFKEKTNIIMQKDSLTIFFLFCIVFTFALSFLISEFGLSKIYQRSNYRAALAENGLESPPETEDFTADSVSLIEFSGLDYYPAKENVSFAMGTVFVSMETLYNAKNTYYIEGLTVIGYTNNKIDYIITSEYSKVVDRKIVTLDPIYYDYFNGALNEKVTVSGTRDIPLLFEIKGIYELGAIREMKDVNLFNILMYNDFIYFSKLNHFRLGNIVFNKIAYYIILILILIISCAVGSSMKNLRAVKNEIFQMASFYVVSFIVTAALYDLLINLSNMVYGLLL